MHFKIVYMQKSKSNCTDRLMCSLSGSRLGTCLKNLPLLIWKVFAFKSHCVTLPHFSPLLKLLFIHNLK